MQDKLKQALENLCEVLKTEKTKRIACVLVCTEFTDVPDDNTRVEADSCVCIVGNNGDIRLMLQEAKKQDTEIAKILEARHDPMQEFFSMLEGLSRRHK